MEAYKAQKNRDDKSVEQQFNIALKNLAKFSDKNIINHLFKVAHLLDISILKEFIYKNIAKLCLISPNCLSILSQDLNGTIIETSGNDEIKLKKQLLENNNFSNLENFHIKRQKKLEFTKDKYKSFIENRQGPNREIMLTDNIKISTRAEQKFSPNGTVSFFKKENGNWVYLTSKNVGYNTQVETITLNPDKSIIVTGQNGLIQFFKIPTINDSNISEMVKIDGTTTLLEDKENISYIKVDYKPKLIAINKNGTKLAVVGELYKENKKEIKLFIYKNINGKWQLVGEILIKENNNIELLRLNWEQSDKYISLHFVEPKEAGNNMIFDEIFPINISKINEQITNLSINKILLLLVLSELNKTTEGQSIINKNRELIIKVLQNFGENI